MRKCAIYHPKNQHAGGQIRTMTVTLLPLYMILAKCLYSSGLSKDTRSMHHFNRREDRLFAENIDVTALAEHVGTPFYCYSTALQQLTQSLGPYDLHFNNLFRVEKANGKFQVCLYKYYGIIMNPGGDLAPVFCVQQQVVPRVFFYSNVTSKNYFLGTRSSIQLIFFLS